MSKVIYAILHTTGSKEQMRSSVSNTHGFFGSSLYVLFYKDIAAVVSGITTFKDLISKEMVLTYASIIAELNDKATLLPMRFGTIVNSDDTISQLLVNHYDSFRNNLKKVENKMEFGLKLIWNYEKSSEKIREKVEADFTGSGSYFTRSTASTSYLMEKIKKHRLEDALLSQAEHLIEDITLPLNQLASMSKLKKMVSNNIILDAVFLVDKNLYSSFTHLVERFPATYNNIRFLLTGPWPPYSFTEVDIK